MKIIQIRGTNGSGKTTVIREYLNRHENDVTSVKVGARKIELHKTENAIVIGRYDRNACGGCDAIIKSGSELKETIAKIARNLRPDVLIFEGVMYGKTYSFTAEIYAFAKAIKAGFVAICLEPPFETTLERIYERNGGKDVNVDGLIKNWRNSTMSNAKLRAMNVPTKTYDTSEMTPEEMGDILEREIAEG